MIWLDCWLLLALTAVGRLAACADCRQDAVPWHVSLHSGHQPCSGALIHQEWVLAAAQCSKSPENLEVWLGEGACPASEERQQVISAAKVIPHQQFNNYTLDSDVMLVKLMRPAALGGPVQLLPLPSDCAPAGTECLASECSSNHTGGRDGALQCRNLTVVADAACSTAYPGRFTENMLCAGQAEGGGQESGKGDMGSPLVCGGALQGLLSWSGGTENLPGLYTKLCLFSDWIHHTLRSN